MQLEDEEEGGIGSDGSPSNASAGSGGKTYQRMPSRVSWRAGGGWQGEPAGVPQAEAQATLWPLTCRRASGASLLATPIA